MQSQTFSLYLHIPFCRAICTYCAFNTYSGMENAIDAFVNALNEELLYIARQKPNLAIKTVFFGGGTPSMLSVPQFELLFSTLNTHFNLLPNAEICIEANPNDITFSYLEGLKHVGINRLSLGMQSSDPKELAMYGRQHDNRMVEDAISNAIKVGINNISLDLIFGNPHQTLDNWGRTLYQAVSYQPKHISLYGLEVKGGTVLKKQIQAGLLPTPDDDLAADMYQLADEILTVDGFRQYELSNWSLPQHQAEHNLQYWRNLPYIGVGAGAHGYVDGYRTIVTRLPQRYITAMMHHEKSLREFPRTPATSKITPVNKESEMLETIMTGLRLTQEGLSIPMFEERFGVNLYELRRVEIDKLVQLNMIEATETSLRLTKAGRFVSNRVISELV